jgi:hypothetical protein
MSNTIKAHIGAALILCVSGVLGSVKLIEMKFIGEVSFVALLCFTVLISLLLAFMWKVESFKASGASIEVKLREIKEAEKSVKELSLAILDVMDAKDHGLMLESYDRQAYAQAVEKVKKLAL